MTRATTQLAGEIDVRVNLLANHSAACALQERAAELLKAARSLQRQLSRTISSRTGATRKSSGTGRYKASATTATSASNKRKKTPARASGSTDGRLIRALGRPSHHGNEGPSRCALCAWYREHGRMPYEPPHGGLYRRPGGKWVVKA